MLFFTEQQLCEYRKKALQLSGHFIISALRQLHSVKGLHAPSNDLIHYVVHHVQAFVLHSLPNRAQRDYAHP